MNTRDLGNTLPTLFSELVDGAPQTEAFMLNRGDAGLLRSLDKLSATAASTTTQLGSSIAAHVDHLRYGLSLMNQWANEGGNPFANAKWDEAWKTGAVDTAAWNEIRNGLRQETQQWLRALKSPREVNDVELTGMAASVGHLAYHLGAIRQINKDARGPKEGTF